MFDGYYPNQFGPGRSAVICQHGAVATSQPLAAQGGLQILKDGGNAVDAAVATAAILNVVEPMSNGDRWRCFYAGLPAQRGCHPRLKCEWSGTLRRRTGILYEAGIAQYSRFWEHVPCYGSRYD